MLNLQQLQGTICHRLSVFGVPPVCHKAYADLICKWVRCSGVEWTVKRLKSLKVDLYRVRSKLPMLSMYKKNAKGQPYGVIGTLFRFALKSERNFQSVIHTLMVYSLFKNYKLSNSQKEKFVKAVSAKTNNAPESFNVAFAKHVKSMNNRVLSIPDPYPILELRGSDSKKAPILDHRSMIQNGSGLASLSYFARSSGHMALYERYESIYKHVAYGFDVRKMYNVCKGFADNVVWGGEVHFLQEPGLKLRAIASPHQVHQVALRPLKETLHCHLSTLPWDCTNDHTKPVSVLQSHLASKRMVHSVDLTNATDYFPLDLQLSALRALFGNHPSIDLFKEISRSSWSSTIGPIKWMQGQPLGLYPSFSSFALTHGYLLHYLLGKRYENEFYVLGDDVVILDDLLYQKYINALGLLGCPFSPDKSLSSNELCEFAGKIITSKRVHPSYKWRELSNDNFVDIVRNYGRKAVALLSPSQKEVIERVQHLVEPIGLNWSFPGSNLEEMTRITDSVYRKMDRDEQSLTGLMKTYHKNMYSVPAQMRTIFSRMLNSSIDTEALLQHSRTFDEKVVATLQLIFPEDWVTAIVDANLQGGYSGVPRALGITKLPLEQETPSRVTTLDRYRKLLNLR